MVCELGKKLTCKDEALRMKCIGDVTFKYEQVGIEKKYVGEKKES